jgi:hypothetical protein
MTTRSWFVSRAILIKRSFRSSTFVTGEDALRLEKLEQDSTQRPSMRRSPVRKPPCSCTLVSHGGLSGVTDALPRLSLQSEATLLSKVAGISIPSAAIDRKVSHPSTSQISFQIPLGIKAVSGSQAIETRLACREHGASSHQGRPRDPGTKGCNPILPIL